MLDGEDKTLFAQQLDCGIFARVATTAGGLVVLTMKRPGGCLWFMDITKTQWGQQLLGQGDPVRSQEYKEEMARIESYFSPLWRSQRSLTATLENCGRRITNVGKNVAQAS